MVEIGLSHLESNGTGECYEPRQEGKADLLLTLTCSASVVRIFSNRLDLDDFGEDDISQHESSHLTGMELEQHIRMCFTFNLHKALSCVGLMFVGFRINARAKWLQQNQEEAYRLVKALAVLGSRTKRRILEMLVIYNPELNAAVVFEPNCGGAANEYFLKTVYCYQKFSRRRRRRRRGSG